MATPLLITKLNVPPIRPGLISRPRLMEQMNAGLQHKLLLISAPAGFGKTTLASAWVDKLQLGGKKASGPADRIAWLSLDEGDDDLARFFTYLIAALNRADGNTATLGTGALGMLQSPQLPPMQTMLTSLINEIAAIAGRVILVLDDFHLIEALPIHEALTFLLEHQPPQMHLVIVTREDPLLPLSRLRARGQLTELRAADLRFTGAEAAEFLNQAMGLDLSEPDIAALEERTEGWIAGLQLAAISLQGKENSSSLIQSFSGSNRLVLDYLIEEVLAQQPPHIQTFLLQTAILERLTGPLCDAVRFGNSTLPGTSGGTTLAEQTNGQAILEMLERANLFIIPLDDERRWYRYHHLFADLLRQRLKQTDPGQLPTLHGRASEWYGQHNIMFGAIHHALAAGDFERAADLAELAWPSMNGSFQSIEWLGWVKTLPDELVRARPVLCVGYAFAYLNAGNLEAAEARLIDAERWLKPVTGGKERMETPQAGMVVVDEEQFQALPAVLASARAYHAQAIGDIPGTVKYTQRVLDLLPEEDDIRRGQITALLGLAQYASGDLEAAQQTFYDGLARMQRAGNVLGIIGGTFVLADMKSTLGHLHEAMSICEQALQLAATQGEPLPVGTEDVYTAMSELHRQRGALETAAQDLATSRRLGEQVAIPDWQYRWCIAQALLRKTQGDLDDALKLLDEAERLYVRTPLPEVRPIAALKARVWVAQGRLVEAQAWAREEGLTVEDDLSYLREFEHITLVRMLIARYKNDRVNGSVDEALDLLERLLKAAEQGGRRGSVIEILVLKSLAYEAQDDIPDALVPLERALVLAEPEGYVRSFVDEGPPMARLLTEALSQGIATAFVRQLLAAFSATEPQKAAGTSRHTPPTELIEPLSEREMEVLYLIAEGLTNQEIANRLYLSPNTVKVHTRNIYGKLDAHHRTGAVVRARALGILPAGS